MTSLLRQRFRLSPHLAGSRLWALGAERLFWLFVAAHVALWTLLPLLVHLNAPLDVIEGMAWGREWELGYPKGPPVFAWILGLLDPLPPGLRLASVFAISQLSIGLTFWGVWKLALRLHPPAVALLAVLLMEGVFYFTFPTPELNEIVLQMPVSALLAWIFHRALDDDRLGDWILVGALAALGMWTRYSSALLLLALGAFLLVPANHAVLRRRGPWIALGVAMLLWLPHVLWMLGSGFRSIEYVGHRARTLAGSWDYLALPLRFAGSQLAAMMPAVLLALALLWRGRRQVATEIPAARPPSPRDRLYVLVIGLGPFLIAEALSLATGMGLRSMWGAPLWCFVGLLAVGLVRPSPSLRGLRRFAIGWALAFMLPLLAYAATHGIRPLVVGHEKRSTFPGGALADAVTQGWHAALGETRLRYVVGSMWLAGNVGFYSSDRPSVFQDADPITAPWIDAGDLFDSGAAIVWNAANGNSEMPGDLRSRFPDALVQPVLTLPRRGFARVPVEIGWAILLPSVDPPAPDPLEDED